MDRKEKGHNALPLDSQKIKGDAEMKKEVTSKWKTEGDLAVIYQVGNLLLFYSKDNDPSFKRGQLLSKEQADNSKPYKATLFSHENIPGDAFRSLTFSWQS